MTEDTRGSVLRGVTIPKNAIIDMRFGAANRDPDEFENPDDMDLHRKSPGKHMAYGTAHHHCIGAPLARREVVVSIERLLARMGNIRLSDEHHGPEGTRRFDYEPTYILRALRHLHLEFDPIG